MAGPTPRSEGLETGFVLDRPYHWMEGSVADSERPTQALLGRNLAAAGTRYAKLRAAGDPARRRSKRLQDLGDAQALVEDHPALRDALSPDDAASLQAPAF